MPGITEDVVNVNAGIFEAHALQLLVVQLVPFFVGELLGPHLSGGERLQVSLDLILKTDMG